MSKYVLGFYFDETMDSVVLIEKKKPKWQEGLLNGLGGKIEDGEVPAQAMQREFKEECGVDVSDWVYIATMYGNDWSVEVFYAIAERGDKFDSVDSKEDEKVITIGVSELLEWDIVSNLQWLIPLCVDKHQYENSEYKTKIQF